MRTAALCLLIALRPASGMGQTAGMGLNPSRIEIEVRAGQEKTTAFEIESPPSDVAVRGRLLLSVTDWDIERDGAVRYMEAGSLPNSASSWIVFSPSAVSISSGQTHLVRVTVRVPPGAPPGSYRTGIFVQERPPAAPPRRGEPVVYLRFRYVFTLYVLVPPVSRQGELINVQIESARGRLRLVTEMRNTGSRPLRPLISWSVLGPKAQEVAAVRQFESVVVLPGHDLQQSFPLDGLPPGEYEIRAEVDFQDRGPLQSVRRTVSVGGEH